MLKLPMILVYVLLYFTNILVMCYPLRPGESLLQSSYNEIKRITNIFAPRFSEELAKSNAPRFKFILWNQEMVNAKANIPWSQEVITTGANLPWSQEMITTRPNTPWSQEMIPTRPKIEEKANILQPECSKFINLECDEQKKLLDRIFKYDNTEIPTASYIKSNTGAKSEPGVHNNNFESLAEDIQTTTIMNDYESTIFEEDIFNRMAPAHVVASLLG